MEPTRIQMQSKKILRDANPSITDCKDSEHNERKCHRPGSLVCVFCFFCARLTEKGQSDLTHGVERGQERGNGQGNEDNQISIAECTREYFILRPEARCQKREAGKSKTADEKSPERDRHQLA